ncbi:alpha/beta hydrolase [Crossiella sp. SN42]|uniref:alpha/beta hydrolase n=1 Tax=Crossiella sp. SN42 TaxID=2944808 RepID=UPI00207D4589|nr:alpha/beta hydrolase [Crossiella sp. SN42]MCO1580397.1 alpha/beta hydrolase [Crossiella sp. SN42]
MLFAAPAVPASAENSVVVHTDISYAPAEPAGSRGHLLDLYVPDGGHRKPRPLLIVTGGSAWLGDDGKAYAAQLAPHFTAAGYVVAGVSTRSSTQAQFPAQVHDVKAAIRWLRVHARTYGIDRTRFAVLGDSSGGWTATMAGVTGGVPGLAGNVGLTGASSTIQAVVNLYGPTDLRQMDAHMLPGACAAFNTIMGTTDCHNDIASPESRLVGCAIQRCPQRAQAANPIRYITPDDPPVLIAHGQRDMLVPHHQSELLYAALKRACVATTFYSVPGVGHAKDIVSPDTPPAEVRSTTGCRGIAPPRNRPTLETIEAFLDTALGVRGP